MAASGEFYVYLIHQDQKLGRPDPDREEKGRPPRKREYTAHAGHYIGMTNNLERRMKEHAAERGAYYMGAVNRAGIKWQPVRTWKFTNYSQAHAWEKQLKARHKAPDLCPCCNPSGWQRRAKGNEP